MSDLQPISSKQANVLTQRYNKLKQNQKHLTSQKSLIPQLVLPQTRALSSVTFKQDVIFLQTQKPAYPQMKVGSGELDVRRTSYATQCKILSLNY